MARQGHLKDLWKSVQIFVWNPPRQTTYQCSSGVSTRYVSSYSSVWGESSIFIRSTRSRSRLSRTRFNWTERKSIETNYNYVMHHVGRIEQSNSITTYSFKRGLDSFGQSSCRCLSTTDSACRKTVPKVELPDKKAKLPKVVSVWKNITVAQLSKNLNRPEGMIFIFHSND